MNIEVPHSQQESKQTFAHPVVQTVFYLLSKTETSLPKPRKLHTGSLFQSNTVVNLIKLYIFFKLYDHRLECRKYIAMY